MGSFTVSVALPDTTVPHGPVTVHRYNVPFKPVELLTFNVMEVFPEYTPPVAGVQLTPPSSDYSHKYEVTVPVIPPFKENNVAEGAKIDTLAG